ncbi:MAG TPA: DNA alkylation repair protein [Streptosporangiaceae bacterium]|nr:DNA alkylation repair protein [Streptosporangiaceae bacterium]
MLPSSKPLCVSSAWHSAPSARRTTSRGDPEFAGVAVPALRSAIVAWCKESGIPDRGQVTAMASALWQSPLYEARQAAVILLERHVRLLALAADADLIEHLLRHSHTWALVDGLATNVADDLAERFDAMAGTLDRWAADPDFWIRRSALLALLKPLRRGEGDVEQFARYAEAMLKEESSSSARRLAGYCAIQSSAGPSLSPPGLARECTGPPASRCARRSSRSPLITASYC